MPYFMVSTWAKLVHRLAGLVNGSITLKYMPSTEALILWFSQNYVSPWLTAVLYSYIPLIVIIVCNIGIVYKLKRARAARSKVATSAQDDDSSRKVRGTKRRERGGIERERRGENKDQWRIQDFPPGGGANSPSGCANLLFWLKTA